MHKQCTLLLIPKYKPRQAVGASNANKAHQSIDLFPVMIDEIIGIRNRGGTYMACDAKKMADFYGRYHEDGIYEEGPTPAVEYGRHALQTDAPVPGTTAAVRGWVFSRLCFATVSRNHLHQCCDGALLWVTRISCIMEGRLKWKK